MPFALLIIGVVILVAGVRGKESDLFSLLSSDVKGFAEWAVAILIVGSLGYIKPIKPITDAFLVLLIVVLMLSNGGFLPTLLNNIKAAAASPSKSGSVSVSFPDLSNSLNSQNPISSSGQPSGSTALDSLKGQLTSIENGVFS